MALSLSFAGCLGEEETPTEPSGKKEKSISVKSVAIPSPPEMLGTQKTGGKIVSSIAIGSGGNAEGSTPEDASTSQGFDNGYWDSARERERRGKLLALLNEDDPNAKLAAMAGLGHLESEGEQPPEVVESLENAVFDPDPDVARVAQGILEDIRSMRDWRRESEMRQEGDQDIHSGELSSGELGPPPLHTINNPAALSPLNRLASQAIQGRDEGERADAINQLTLHSSRETVEILLQASVDPAPNNRQQVIRALGHSAAIGLDEDGRITSVLVDALWDPDEKVVELAQRALNDLGRLDMSSSNSNNESIEDPEGRPTGFAEENGSG